MKTEIQKELKKIEEELDVKILYAIESGSRAWGFPSKNSDWDVRFIYVHKLDWYLSIDLKKKDSFDLILPNDIDLSGWELRKTLQLFSKSNPALMEWLRSPIEYYKSYSTIDKLREMSQVFFNPKACLYHYLNMAKVNHHKYLRDEKVKIKKYFYVLRPLLACMWIEKTGKMAPMEFDILVESQVGDAELKQEIKQLQARKMSGEELDIEYQIGVIHSFIEEKLEYFTNYLANFDHTIKPDTELLDQLFRETLDEIGE
jgi:uncharacterized protein